MSTVDDDGFVYVHADIEGHLPYLRRLASLCNDVIEFGTRAGNGSTLAFVRGAQRSVTAYDLKGCGFVPKLKEIAAERGITFELIIADVREIKIPETDLLFIDTHHTYEQLSKELELHGEKARKYMAFHDTHLFPEMTPALYDYLEAHPSWVVGYDSPDWCGLTVVRRKHVDLPDLSASAAAS